MASSDLPSPATTLGIYVESGSRFDEVSGTAHLMQHMAFKVRQSSRSCLAPLLRAYAPTGADCAAPSPWRIFFAAWQSSNSMSALKMVTVCENAGATVSALSSRENTVYQIDTLKSSVPELVGLLAETTLAPKFLSWEVEEAHGTVKAELEDLKLNHQALLQEMAHAAAYGRAAGLKARRRPLPAHPTAPPEQHLGDLPRPRQPASVPPQSRAFPTFHTSGRGSPLGMPAMCPPAPWFEKADRPARRRRPIRLPGPSEAPARSRAPRSAA